MKDDSIYSALRSGDLKKRTEAFAYFFSEEKLRNTVISHVMKNGGNRQDAEDLFTDSLIILEQSIKDGKFKRESLVSTYFIGICKRKWLGVLRQRGKSKIDLRPDLLDFEKHKSNDDAIPADLRLIKDDRNNKLHQLLDEIGERCKKVLMSYGLNFSNKEIAKELDISPEAAKQAVKNCRNKLRKLIIEKGVLEQLKL